MHFVLQETAYWNPEHPLVCEPAAWERWGAQTVKQAQTNGATGASGAWLKERSLEEIREELASPTKNRRGLLDFPVRPVVGAHGATMPPELAALLVAAATPPGGHVLDPFCGAGTTALAARHLGMTCTGVELSGASVEEACERLRRELGGPPGSRPRRRDRGDRPVAPAHGSFESASGSGASWPPARDERGAPCGRRGGC